MAVIHFIKLNPAQYLARKIYKVSCSHLFLKDDLCMKQVEYQFSDMSLLANESLMKHVSRDPEGYGKELNFSMVKFSCMFNMDIIFNNLYLLLLWYSIVPVSVIASTKKIKSLTSNHHMIVQALRCSSKLVSLFDFFLVEILLVDGRVQINSSMNISHSGISSLCTC